ncbi:MAG: MFS transporter [Syntrophomonadaceae bacterium]|jgi:EmrB/QacA subfamily drug resistance transporter
MLGDTYAEKTTLYTVMTTSFMTTFMGSSINLALPAMGLEFGSSAILASWAITSYILASAIFLLPFGRLADMHGRRRFYRLGTILYTLFTLATAMADSMQMIIVFRLLQGLSSAMIFSTGMAILSSVYPPHKRGRALGYSVAVTYLGLTIGPVLGGMMNHYLGWRSIFYLTTLLGLGAVTAIQFWLRGEWAGARGEKFDAAGSSLYMVGLLAFLYGLSSISDSQWSPYLVLLGVILLVGFAAWELHIDHPILQVRLFKHNTGFAFSNLAAMINYSATYAVTFLLSVYLQVVRGYDSQAAGLILLAQPLVMTILSPLAGTLSDRLEPRLVASLGMGCSTLSLFFFIFIGSATAPSLLVINLLLAGLGFALFASPNNNAIMGSVPMRLYGIASSTLGTMRLVGQAISMSIVTLLITLFIGRAPLTAANPATFLACMKVSFAVFTIICILGVLASLKRGSLHQYNLTDQDQGKIE